MDTTIPAPLTPLEIDRAAIRNDFHAYTMPPTWVSALVDEAERAGVYTTGIESVRRSRGPRGTSINTAVMRTNGVFRVQAGIRSKVWGFTAPRGD